MIKELNKKYFKNKNLRDLDNICEECKEEDLTVRSNLIMTGYKLCDSCSLSN